jgi:hypothetical protein
VAGEATPAQQLINTHHRCDNATRVEAAEYSRVGILRYRLSLEKIQKSLAPHLTQLLHSFTVASRELYCVMSGIELRHLYGFTLPPTLCHDRCDAST